MSDERSKQVLKHDQNKELQRFIDEMINLSMEVVEDYEGTPSELSGSITQINENSPFLDERFEGESWKRIIKNIPSTPDNIEEDKDASK